MKKMVIVINGKARSGKDTICGIASKYYKTVNVSSIKPITDIARQIGWDGKKDAKSRKFLSDLKQLIVEFNDLPNMYLQKELHSFLVSEKDIMFVHIREKEQILSFVNYAKEYCPCVTLLVRRSQDSFGVIGNDSDDCVEELNYDYYYNNDSTLLALHKEIPDFIKNIITKSKSKSKPKA